MFVLFAFLIVLLLLAGGMSFHLYLYRQGAIKPTPTVYRIVEMEQE
jgi:hypothetical protein